MDYDAAHGQVVLFGGYGGSYFGDTWTWDGADWTQRTPAHAPPPQYDMGLTYDSARGQVVLFSGDTWTWDGTDWTQRTPAHAPSARCCMGMSDDAVRGQVVLFGGGYCCPFGDTWTWDGTDWTVPLLAWITLTPSSGPPGTTVQVQGRAYGGVEEVVLRFVDSIAGTTRLATVITDGDGTFTTQVAIPLTATAGKQRVRARALASGQRADRAFTVT
jgi:hypothetical protein